MASELVPEIGPEIGSDITLTDDGDLPLTEDTAQDDAMIRRHVAYVREDGDIPFALGGDHAVTFPLVEAAAACHGPVPILHFDAPPDPSADFAGHPRSAGRRGGNGCVGTGRSRRSRYH